MRKESTGKWKARHMIQRGVNKRVKEESKGNQITQRVGEGNQMSQMTALGAKL